MKLQTLALALALLPAALFAAGGNSGGGTTSSPSTPTIIPGGVHATTYVISTSGSYVLGGNRSSSGTIFVIEIAAPDVTLDLNGFAVSNVVGTSGPGGGISVPTPENVEIRNGSILNAANYGIRASYGKGVRVIDVRVVGAAYAGIAISAASAQIDRCNVSDSGQFGIWAGGGGALVTDCVVSGGVNCIGVSVNSGARIIRTVARSCKEAFALLTLSTASDCLASNSGIGFRITAHCTLRDVEVVGNVNGVSTSHSSNVIMGTRIGGNTANFVDGGIYTNGGGNVLQ